MSHPLLQDAYVAAEVERALVGIDAALSEDDRRWIRDQLACLLEEDLAELLRGAHPRGAVDRSGEVPRVAVSLEDDDRAAEG